MCGIVGYFSKTDGPRTTGATLLGMLGALGRRGPDSAGVAVWGQAVDGMLVRVAARDRELTKSQTSDLLRRARRVGPVKGVVTQGPLLRFEIATVDADALVAALEADAEVEVVSLGHRLQIVKQVGSPRNLDVAFAISALPGTHGIGHTRLSTESRVDLSHSQPFWAHGVPDLAVVHNGHITNYHRLRRLYEQDGVRFYTENDSEVIGCYLARKIRAGVSLREALAASVRDLDGSFSYLAATADVLGFAKDPHCLKPLIVAETERAVAIANEEIAVHAVLGDGYRAREAGAGEVATWQIRGRPVLRAPRRRQVA
ncbi:MAG TPA: glutamine phosphoribosylpyrophosphate amidotransferase [Methylomirabilota bacterium]|jgi:glutamate synthase domain-containing protein 1|nr:glutamine phosphoribosylpyrophosphate amidotransferase [Methylomirabilota bacterium]